MYGTVILYKADGLRCRTIQSLGHFNKSSLRQLCVLRCCTIQSLGHFNKSSLRPLCVLQCHIIQSLGYFNKSSQLTIELMLIFLNLSFQNIFHILGVVISLVLYVAVNLAVSLMSPTLLPFASVYGVFFETICTANFWFLLPVTIVIALLPRYAYSTG